MSEEKDCSSVAGVQAGLRPTDGPRSAGVCRVDFERDGWTVDDIAISGDLISMARVEVMDGRNCWGAIYLKDGRDLRLWFGVDKRSLKVTAEWEGSARSSEEQSISPSEASAGTPATDEHKYSISPSPLPEGLDLAELRHRAEVAEAAAALMAEQRDRLQARLETAEREGDEARATIAEAHDAYDATDVPRTDDEAPLSLSGRMDELQRQWAAHTDRLQADLARARDALEPFTHEPIPAETPDSAPIMAVMTPLWAGDFRRASEVFTSLSEKGDKGLSRSQPCVVEPQKLHADFDAEPSGARDD